MIAVIAPEPAPWLASVVEAARALGPVWLLAPFAVPVPPPSFLPARLQAPWRRRHLALDVRLQTVPGWLAAEAALRRWAGGRADRLIRGRMLSRAAVDALAARLLPEGVTAVVAPSFSARRTFSEAARRGARRLLVEDLPGLRQLHADLDGAALAVPGSRFLLRHRASAGEVARQEMERVLADRVLVRGRYAWAALVNAGLDPGSVLPLAEVRAALLGTAVAAPGGWALDAAGAQALPRPSPRRVLLAGLATARSGSFEALAALERLPGVTLLVRPGEGLEPAELLRHPRVERVTEAERRTLAGVDAVLAPAWCESYPEEVATAAERGVPVIATARAAGWLSLARAGHEVAPGDVAALVRALAVPEAR